MRARAAARHAASRQNERRFSATSLADRSMARRAGGRQGAHMLSSRIVLVALDEVTVNPGFYDLST